MPEPEQIKNLLHRRSDLSSFINHFTRGTPSECEDHIVSILGSQRLVAATAFGMAAHFDLWTESRSVTQRTVCFTDTPIEHSWMMVRKIAGRAWEFQPYGVVFSKEYARAKGCHPVWYLDAFGPEPSMATAAKNLIEFYRGTYAANPAGWVIEGWDILRLTPFMELRASSKDFVWEREWRHRGDFTFESPNNVVAVFAPEGAHFQMRQRIHSLSPVWATRDVPILDPAWGTDKIIHTLSKGT